MSLRGRRATELSPIALPFGVRSEVLDHLCDELGSDGRDVAWTDQDDHWTSLTRLERPSVIDLGKPNTEEIGLPAVTSARMRIEVIDPSSLKILQGSRNLVLPPTKAGQVRVRTE